MHEGKKPCFDLRLADCVEGSQRLGGLLIVAIWKGNVSSIVSAVCTGCGEFLVVFYSKDRKRCLAHRHSVGKILVFQNRGPRTLVQCDDTAYCCCLGMGMFWASKNLFYFRDQKPCDVKRWNCEFLHDAYSILSKILKEAMTFNQKKKKRRKKIFFKSLHEMIIKINHPGKRNLPSRCVGFSL